MICPRVAIGGDGEVTYLAGVEWMERGTEGGELEEHQYDK